MDALSDIDALAVLTVVPLLFALILIVSAFLTLFRKRWIGSLTRLGVAALLLGIAVASGAVGVATQGYRALGQETLAATVAVTRLGEQRYSTIFTFPDGTERAFNIAGDQLYVDANVLKWHPVASYLGLSTAYELDRVAGRYLLLDDEQTLPRTVYSLARAKPVDMLDMTRRFAPLERFVDAEYGSGTFVPLEDGARYRISVSTTGLLVRQAEGATGD
ncbi:MAG: hypothetical protein U5L04_07515 [Trueperaceae bacterium]|nr:hypothetical protein [Trueperaceae bacterium]